SLHHRRVTLSWVSPREFENAFVELLSQTEGDSLYPQYATTMRLRLGYQASIGSHEPVQVVEDGTTIEQQLPIIELQDRHLAQRIELQHLCKIAEHRQDPALEGHAVQVQRHCNPTHEGRVVLANEDHAR